MLPPDPRPGRGDDDALLDWLSDVAAAVDPAPARVAELARAAFAAARQPAWEPPRRARSAPCPRRPCPGDQAAHRVG
jgi:hypothetical protein